MPRKRSPQARSLALLPSIMPCWVGRAARTCPQFERGFCVRRNLGGGGSLIADHHSLALKSTCKDDFKSPQLFSLQANAILKSTFKWALIGRARKITSPSTSPKAGLVLDQPLRELASEERRQKRRQRQGRQQWQRQKKQQKKQQIPHPTAAGFGMTAQRQGEPQRQPAVNTRLPPKATS